jgi:hypothetical protein
MAPANTNPDQGKRKKFASPGIGRRYASIGSGSASRIGVDRTTGVRNAIPSATAPQAIQRARVDVNAPHTAAAATMDGPMMLRMSTLRSVRGAPHPSIQACTLKTNARKNTHPPRLITARAAALTSPLRRHFDPAESATDVPARKRNIGAPNPATIIAQSNVQDARASSLVQLSSRCA